MNKVIARNEDWKQIDNGNDLESNYKPIVLSLEAIRQ